MLFSHRWEDDEVLFQDVMQGTASQKKGYHKIDSFCRVAKKEGFRQQAVYTGLDASGTYRANRGGDPVSRMEGIWDQGQSLRGDFRHHKDQHPRTSACGTAGALLRCPEAVLKLSWAATRETTRREDRAYSLMGLFGVNMPLLYGEGDKAFMRLQMEILQMSNDQSILAWKSGMEDLRGQPCNVIAQSPGNFVGCHTITYSRRQIDRDLAKNDFVSGVAEFPLEVVGSFIKIKALSLPYSGLAEAVARGPHEQCPPWLASVYEMVDGHMGFKCFDSWIVFLEDYLKQDRTVGIILSRSGNVFTRVHVPLRILLPKRPGPSDDLDLKERTFDVKVSFGKGAKALDPKVSPKLSSPDLQLGAQEFGLAGDFFVVVKARKGVGGKILLHILVENKQTGEMLKESDLGV
ncbi:hypothetical protein ACJ41O_001604 [Fusarium nematophilum]